MKLAAATLGILAIVSSRRAYAQAEVQLTVEPSGASKAPAIEATIINGALVPVDKLKLVEQDGIVDGKKQPIVMRATRMRPYTQGNERIAIAVLVEGHQLFMGSPDEPDAGALKGVAAALDVLTDAGPVGAKGELVVYGNSAVVKLPMGDLRHLSGAALGNQKDYARTTARELKAGVEQALADLDKQAVDRRFLIIIGDGADTNPDNKAALAALKKQNDAKGKVEIWAVFYDTKDENLQADVTVVKAIAGTHVKTVTTVMDLAPAMSAIVGQEIQNRYYVTFPGFDERSKVGFTWDGKDHTFTLGMGDDETDVERPLTMQPVWTARH